jgi:type IV secretory pathway VirB10-like protein
MEQDTVKFGRTELHAFASSPHGKPRWLLVLAVAAAMLVVLAALATVSYKYKWNLKQAAVVAPPVSSSAAPPPALSTAAPPPGPGAGVAQPSPGLAATPVPPASAATSAKPAKPSEPTPKVRKHEPAPADPTAARAAKSQAKLPKPAAAANCDLDSNMLPKMLDQAEKNRQQGNYPAALRQFRAVLACDRKNARARSGLDLTELAMQH